MKIVTWNINGIRSLKEEWKDVLAPLNADIVCLQETKVSRDNLDEATAFVEGYTSYFSCCRKRTGYSGVATFCKTSFTPVRSEEGLAGTLPSSNFEDRVGFYDGIESEFTAEELRSLESEGRSVITSFEVEMKNEKKILTLINVYCPRTDVEKFGREEYQLNFYKLLEIRANALIKAGHIVVIVGDINTSHRIIDHCDPYEEFGDRPGRKWLDHLLVGPVSDDSINPDLKTDWVIRSTEVDAHSFVDSFRKFHPERESAFTCWMTRLNCRENNYGTRLDYILVSALHADQILLNCDIHPEIHGSDHCPVMATFSLTSLPSAKPPKFCTKFFPEFTGTQQKLSAFLVQNLAGKEKPEVEKRKPEILNEQPVAKKSRSCQQKNLFSFFKPKATPVLSTEIKESVDKAQVVDVQVDSENFEQIDPSKRLEVSKAWKSIMKGPPAPPLCSGHREPADLKTVKKKGPNCGRQFWCCRRGEGKVGDPNTRCEFFKWRK